LGNDELGEEEDEGPIYRRDYYCKLGMSVRQAKHGCEIQYAYRHGGDEKVSPKCAERWEQHE